MSGMVMTPVVATLETALPEIEPNIADATTEIFAAPPRLRPIVAIARSVKNSPPPVLNRSWPRKMNRITMVTETLSAAPSSALGSKPRYIGSSSIAIERPVSGAGTRWPTIA